MKTRLVEATTGPRGNHAKVLLGVFDDEWDVPSQIKAKEIAGVRFPMLSHEGWSRSHMLILDLATGEGAILLPGGLAVADLAKHRIWVCPLFEPFVARLWTAAKAFLADGIAPEVVPGLLLALTPDVTELTFEEAPFSMSGYRRPGPSDG